MGKGKERKKEKRKEKWREKEKKIGVTPKYKKIFKIFTLIFFKKISQQGFWRNSIEINSKIHWKSWIPKCSQWYF